MPIKQSSVFLQVGNEKETDVCGVPLETVQAIIQDILPGITIKEVEDSVMRRAIAFDESVRIYVESLDLPQDSKNFHVIRIINVVAWLAYEKTTSEYNTYYWDLRRGVELINDVRNACQMDDREKGVKGVGAVMEVICSNYETYILHTMVTRYPKFKYE